MTFNSTFVFAVVGGGLLGLGLFLVLVQLIPAAPALGPALNRLHPGVPRVGPPTFGGRLKRQISVPRADLAILAQSTDLYYTRLAVAALVGFLMPGFVAAFIMLMGFALPVLLSAIVSVGVAVLVVFMTHHEVLVKAERARAEFR